MAATDDTIPQSRILIVDDNHQNLELLEAYLEDAANITTIRATSGEECLRLVGEQSPDLILLDIMMPHMSGYEVCKALRREEATRDIPVILVTALHEMADVELGMDVGANDFLTKPVNRVDLLARINTLLRVRHFGEDASA
ncbi:MAG TPA: response regulator [Phycisphaerae bacterium]|nr:response regulator [Phycisphaerae bacterium]HRW54732.1 response regulator [Phycisphaerae bacterium]